MTQITIGSLATQLLQSGKSSQDTLTTVLRVFPEAKTTMKCIYFYASKAGIKLGHSQVIDQVELDRVLAELNPKAVKAAK